MTVLILDYLFERVERQRLCIYQHPVSDMASLAYSIIHNYLLSATFFIISIENCSLISTLRCFKVVPFSYFMILFEVMVAFVELILLSTCA